MSSAQTPSSSTSRPSASSNATSEIQSGIDGNSFGTQTAHQGHTHPQSLNDRASSAVNVGVEDVDPIHEVQGQRRQRPKNSGGFLLPSASKRNTHPAALRHSAYETTGSSKGKRKAEDEDLSIPQSRIVDRRHRFKTSLGSSPLSTEIYNVTPTRGSGDTARTDPDEISPLPSRTSRTSGSFRSTVSGDTEWESRKQNQGQHLDRDTRNALGHDTDPVQIVNLALNLSENRRRNFSGGRLSPIYPAGSRRVVSSNQPSAGLSGSYPTISTGGSLRQHLQDQRRISRNISPRASRLQRQVAETQLVPSYGTPQPTVAPTFDVGLASNTIFNPTEATLTRTERAKLALELSYEYRRLLQYLPKIPVWPRSRSTTTKTAAKANSDTLDILGRAYNPLQYVRNRRVRAREKTTLDAEADGWKNVDRVRKWVDTVASEREAGISRVDDHYPLPPYDVALPDLALLDPSLALGGSHSTGQSGNKSRKLPGNWTITPWDLLADACWLGRDANIRRIEDSSGNKIFTSTDILSQALPRASRDSERAPKRSLETIHKHMSADSLLPAMTVTQDSPRERGRPRKELSLLHSPMHSHNSSLDRKGRWPKNLIQSRSSSSSGHSPTDKVIGRGRVHRDHDGFDSAALKKQMNDILKREADDALLNKRDTADRAYVKPSNQAQANGKISQGESQWTGLQGTRTEKPASDSIPASARVSLDERKDRQPRTSFDSVRNSSNVHGSSPKIAINLALAGDQPSSPKKTLPSRLGSFRPSRSKERQAISQQDFASESESPSKTSRKETNRLKSEDSLQSGNSLIANDGLLSPDSADVVGKRQRYSDSSSIKNIKITREFDSKLRGFLKGGRIAELMGNEVSRVGDLFWRRDRDNTASPVSPTVSSFTMEDSEYDDDDTSGLDSPPSAPLSRATTNNEDIAMLSRKSTNVEPPKYHMDNLPSFRSPFGRGDHFAESTKSPPEQDHITRQQLEQRQRGRSQRFDRLAPPRIDMRNVSPSASPPMTRSRTRDTDVSYDGSRQSSTSRSDYRAQIANRKLNEVLGSPGTIGRRGPPPSGLSRLESRQHRPTDRPNLDKGRQWSICDRGVSSVRGTVTKRDIAQVRALLLSSGVKANEIVRRANAVGQAPVPLLKGLEEISSGPIPSGPRSQEHRLAARILVNNIELTNQRLRDMAGHFSNTTVEHLHRQIKGIDERVTYSLTPMVRATADDADSFSAQLTTTHTLAVQQLNDAVDAILRTRRRRLRWLRRGGYLLLEWTLLGIMWWVWFVVVLIRLARGILRGAVSGVRWFFWL